MILSEKHIIKHKIEAVMHINIISLIMGVVSLSVILIAKKFVPKFPMSLVVMIIGALSTVIFHVDRYGVALLSKVDSGLPKFFIPDLSIIHFKDGLMLSLPVAIVILAESLLAETSFAIRNNYKINENREILAFSLSNLVSAVSGCCPDRKSVV